MDEKNTMQAPILIAHRGYAKRYPENTLIALEAALAAGACCVEFDVQLTQDRVPVLLHDANLKRTTGSDQFIFDVDSAVLKNLKIKESKTGLKKFAEIGIPTLADAVDLLKRWPCARAFVEIKQETLDQFGIEKVIKRLAQECKPVVDRCVLIARNELALRCGRAMGFDAIGWILAQYDDEAQTIAAGLAPDYLLCNHKKLPKDIKQVWSGPWQWAFYEVTQAKLALKLSKLGVKFVETMAVAEMLKNSSLRSMSCVEK